MPRHWRSEVVHKNLQPISLQEWAYPGGTTVKNLPANARDAGDPGLISELGQSSGVGNGNPLQYSCLEKFMDRGAWQATLHEVTKSLGKLNIAGRKA